MFETPPAFSIPVANLTGWFNWDAIAAIFTAWALWFALRQAGKAERLEMERLSAVIASYWAIVDGYAKALAKLEQQLEAGVHLSAKGFSYSRVTEHALAILDQYSFRDFPGHRLMSEQAIVKMTIKDIGREIDTVSDNVTLAKYVREARVHLEQSIETAKQEAKIAFASGFRRAWLRAKQRAERRKGGANS